MRTCQKVSTAVIFATIAACKSTQKYWDCDSNDQIKKEGRIETPPSHNASKEYLFQDFYDAVVQVVLGADDLDFAQFNQLLDDSRLCFQ